MKRMLHDYLSGLPATPFITKRRAMTVISVIGILIGIFALTLPDIKKLKKERPGKTAMMELREKQWADKKIKRTITQEWTPLSSVSPYLIKAVLIAEDDNFWEHEGFDYEGMIEAMEKNISSMKFKAGGSTISQQLSKNLYLSPSRNPLRKFREAVITWRMERTLSKKRILELYLNVAEWGDGIFGVEAASRRWFGKSSFDLTPMEATRLASVLPNPKKYDPSGTQRYVEKRSELIYTIMVKRGIVPPDFEEITSAPNSEEEASETETQDVKPSEPAAIPDENAAPPEETPGTLPTEPESLK
ncbi:MAG: monofunctional biosynthetic peptidoglycan transglycosylase [Thermodesulfobacteriota bacterium]